MTRHHAPRPRPGAAPRGQPPPGVPEPVHPHHSTDPPDGGRRVAFYPDRVDRATASKARTPSEALRLPENPDRSALAKATGRAQIARLAVPGWGWPSSSGRPLPAPPAPRHATAAIEPPGHGSAALPQPPTRLSWWRRVAARLRSRRR